MKYSYHIEYVKDGTPVMRLPAEIALVTLFLVADVQRSSAEYFLPALDQVLNGEETYMEVSGNMCGLEIKKDFTRVVNILAEDGIGDACKIETEELRELIVIWSKVPWRPSTP